jgi:hypothetical protein
VDGSIATNASTIALMLRSCPNASVPDGWIYHARGGLEPQDDGDRQQTNGGRHQTYRKPKPFGGHEYAQRESQNVFHGTIEMRPARFNTMINTAKPNAIAKAL